MTKITINPLLVAILFITSVCSCDRFRVNICQANLDYESCIIPAGSSDPTEANRFDMSMRTSAADLAGPTNGAKFTNVGNIDLAPAGYKQRFAGSLSGGSIIFMRNTHTRLIEYRLAGNGFNEQQICTKCTLITSELDWDNHIAYTANDTLIRLRNANSRAMSQDSVCVWKTTEIFPPTCYNDTLLTVRPAISFLGNGFSYGLDPRGADNYSSKLIFNSIPYMKSYNNTINPTFLTIGSIYMKRTPASMELLYFNNTGLLYLDSMEIFDPTPLKCAIQTAMNSTRSTNPSLDLILGADIADINTDNQAELLYIRGQKVYALTIQDTESPSSPLVSHWSAEVINLASVLAGDSIKSLRAVDINGDSRPDLAIETDKRVLFYLNQAE